MQAPRCNYPYCQTWRCPRKSRLFWRQRSADARFNYFWDIHLPGEESEEGYAWRPDYYEISYRAILLTAGRCISTDHQALASMRLMSCCTAIGEAAGTAAPSVQERVTLRRLDIQLLQQTLNNGAKI